MRILVLIHEYPPIGGGGGRVAQDICHGLAARGHDVQVLSAHWQIYRVRRWMDWSGCIE
jgi:hypothetical protein